MKPIGVKRDSFAAYNEESNEKDPKFKVGEKNLFAKGCASNWSKEIFVIKKYKIQYLGFVN